MPKFRRDVQPLFERSIDSLTLGIELFNRPTDTARAHAVPMLLHHAFELVLKASIAQLGEAAEGVILKQEVNPFDKYNLGRDELASKLNLSGPRTSALIIDLNICDDPDCYREIKIKS